MYLYKKFLYLIYNAVSQEMSEGQKGTERTHCGHIMDKIAEKLRKNNPHTKHILCTASCTWYFPRHHFCCPS